MSTRGQWFAAASCALTIIGAAGTTSIPTAHGEDSLFFLSGTRNTPAPQGPISLGSISSALTGFGATAMQLAYEASLFPAVGRIALDPSVATGVAALNAAIATAPAGNRIVVIGVSQGNIVASTVERSEIAAGDTRNFLFVRVGDPSSTDGIMGRNSGIRLPGLTFVTAPAESPWDTVVIAHQYEGLSDWPVQQANLIADINALLGAIAYHNPWSYNVDLSSIPAGNVTVTVNSLGATTTRYLIPATGLLPILRPLQALGVQDPVLQKLQTALKPIVDSAYQPLPNTDVAAQAQQMFVTTINAITALANQTGVMLRQAQTATAAAVARWRATTPHTTPPSPAPATPEETPGPAETTSQPAPIPEATHAGTDTQATPKHQDAQPKTTAGSDAEAAALSSAPATAAADDAAPATAGAKDTAPAPDSVKDAATPASSTGRSNGALKPGASRAPAAAAAKPTPRTPTHGSRTSITRPQPVTTTEASAASRPTYPRTSTRPEETAAATAAPTSAPQHESNSEANDD